MSSNPFAVKVIVFAALAALFLLAVTAAKARYIPRITQVDQRRSARRIVNVTTFGVIVVAGALTFANRLTGLAVSLGVLGAAVGFALQQVLASGVAWLQITIGGVYDAGDRVKMGGVIGDVMKINTFLTTLMEIRGDWVNGDQYTGRVVRVPNAAIYQEPVYNYSAGLQYLWDELMVPLRYGSDRALAVRIMHDAVAPLASAAAEEMRSEWSLLREKYEIEDTSLEPTVYLVTTDNWLEYTIRYPVHYKRRRDTKSALCEALLAKIDEHADKVGIASGTYDIVGLPPLQIELTEPSARQTT